MFPVLKRALALCNLVCGLASGFCILLVGLILFVEVVLRYAGHPTQWIPETSVYLFCGAMLCGAAYTLQQGSHVRVELLIMHLPLRVRIWLDVATALGGAAFCALVTVHAWEHLADVLLTGETTPTAMRVPLWITDLPLFVGFVLLTLQFLAIALTLAAQSRVFHASGAKSATDTSVTPGTSGANGAGGGMTGTSGGSAA